MLLYKYRGIQSFRFFADIILKERLYAAPYFDLNDPMEGRYLYSQSGGEIYKEMAEVLKGLKEKLRICSLSRDKKNELMWSHYAEGHKGVAIGVEVDETKHQVCPIIYDGLHQISLNNFGHSSAVDILSHKLDVWNYEDEVRVFTFNKQHVQVSVKEIVFGSRMSTQDKGFITDLVKAINPSIKVSNARTNAVYV